MKTVVVQYTTKPDRADENQVLVEAVFAALADDPPGGLSYRVLRLADGVTFIHAATIDTPDGSNPLLSVAAFQAFSADLADRLVDGPHPSDATVVGSFPEAT